MFPTVDDVSYGGQGKVPKAAVDRMVADLEKQYVHDIILTNIHLEKLVSYKMTCKSFFYCVAIFASR